MGELLKQFDECGGDDGTVNSAPTQKQVAVDNDISDLRVTFVRAAHVPDAEFEAVVDGDNPATVANRMKPFLLLDEAELKQTNALMPMLGVYNGCGNVEHHQRFVSGILPGARERDAEDRAALTAAVERPTLSRVTFLAAVMITALIWAILGPAPHEPTWAVLSPGR